MAFEVNTTKHYTSQADDCCVLHSLSMHLEMGTVYVNCLNCYNNKRLDIKQTIVYYGIYNTLGFNKT